MFRTEATARVRQSVALAWRKSAPGGQLLLQRSGVHSSPPLPGGADLSMACARSSSSLYVSCRYQSGSPYSREELKAERMPFGTSDDDAFGEKDALTAVENVLKQKETKPDGNAVPNTESSANDSNNKEEDLPEELDPMASARNRRRNRKKKTMDEVLGDVLHDAIKLRDMGQKPDADFVHKRTQERMYEEEYGQKPPSMKEHAQKYIPFPPDFTLHRLLPVRMFEDDPWPERSITPENPVWTNQQLQEDREKTGGKVFAEMEKRLFDVREGYEPVAEFLDALDEHAHWEEKYIDFLRIAPLSQRRSLPYLHEYYRMITHRLIRAEKRYLRTRDATLARTKASPSLYSLTEQRVDHSRSLYAETHRSLSSPNYNPAKMKKSIIGPLMGMSADEYNEWKRIQKHRRDRLISEIV